MAYKVGTTTVIDDSGKIDWSRIANAPSTNPMTAIAAASAGGVGTYALVGRYSSVNHSFGDTVSGSSLYIMNLYSSSNITSGASDLGGDGSGVSLSGTWRLLYDGTLTSSRTRVGIALRIA